MKTSMMIAGVCLLVLLTIAECRNDVLSTVSPKQDADCDAGLLLDLTACALLVDEDDISDFCDADCVDVVEQFFDCSGTSTYLGFAIDELEDMCGDGTTVTVSAISTVTAIVVAIAAAMY